MSDLAEKNCIPCQGGVAPLKGEELNSLSGQLAEGWDVIDEHHLEKQYSFKTFRAALEFVNKVGDMADEQDHHPDIEFGWGRAKITIWTHKIDGLTESDFVFAAKTEQCL